MERISRRSKCRAVRRRLIRLIDQRLDCGLNGTGADDLAKGARGTKLGRGVKIGSTLMLDLAQPGNFIVMMKDFGGDEMNLSRQQHAGNKGVNP